MKKRMVLSLLIFLSNRKIVYRICVVSASIIVALNYIMARGVSGVPAIRKMMRTDERPDLWHTYEVSGAQNDQQIIM